MSHKSYETAHYFHAVFEAPLDSQDNDEPGDFIECRYCGATWFDVDGDGESKVEHYNGCELPLHLKIEEQEQLIKTLRSDLVIARDLTDSLEEALIMWMRWLGPPPIDRYSYDSKREDAWKKSIALVGNKYWDSIG